MTYRKSYEIIGYKYNADIHCPECAYKRFPRLIKHDDYENILDSEGNEVSPIFLQEEFDSTPYCGTCLEELDY